MKRGSERGLWMGDSVSTGGASLTISGGINEHRGA